MGRMAPMGGESRAGVLTDEGAALGAAIEMRLGKKRHGLMFFIQQTLKARRLACCLVLAACQMDLTKAAPAASGGVDDFADRCEDCTQACTGVCSAMDSSELGCLKRRVATAGGEEGLPAFAAVHRRWSPRHLRFGLREAWCFSKPLQIFSGQERVPAGRSLSDPVLEDAHESTKDHARFRFKSACAGAQLMGSTATDPPFAARQHGLRGHAFRGHGSDAGLARITACGWAWLGRDGKARAGNGGLVKPWGDPLWARYPSADQVAQYFSEALDERPVCQGRDMVVFQRSQCFGWGVSWRRGLVEVLPLGVGVRWLANDDFGLSELREFFEAGFFKPEDTERFYRWLAEGGWHQASIEGGVRLKMSVLRGKRATLVEISWQRGG
jgi:hypothetical protein